MGTNDRSLGHPPQRDVDAIQQRVHLFQAGQDRPRQAGRQTLDGKLGPDVAVCLQGAVWAVLSDPSVIGALAAAKRPISARDAASTREAIDAVMPETESLRLILQDEMKRLRS